MVLNPDFSRASWAKTEKNGNGHCGKDNKKTYKAKTEQIMHNNLLFSGKNARNKVYLRLLYLNLDI